MLTLLIVLLVIAVLGGFAYDGGTYRGHGIGLGGLILIAILLVVLLD